MTSIAALVSSSAFSKLAVTTTPLFTAVSSSLAATLSAAAVTCSAASIVGVATKAFSLPCIAFRSTSASRPAFIASLSFLSFFR